jgi:Nif-specific ferredoxin III
MAKPVITGRTRGGEEWVPEFVVDVNAQKCIGCGRCFKVCPRNVFELKERGEVLAGGDDDFDDDDEMMVMTVENAEDCIGCTACGKVCPKQCHSHEPAAA